MLCTRLARAAWRALVALLAGAALVTAAAAAEPWAGDDSRILKQDLTPTVGQTLRVEIPFGDLRLEPSDGGQAEIEVEARCRHHGEACRNRLARLELDAQSRPHALRLRIDGLSHWSSLGLELKVHVRVPANQRVEVEMGAGEIRVADWAADLKVHLGAGDIAIHMLEAAVRGVDLEAGIGDAKLRRHGGSIDAGRSHLVGAEVHWEDGRGDAHADVEVGAGDVDLCLD